MKRGGEYSRLLVDERLQHEVLNRLVKSNGNIKRLTSTALWNRVQGSISTLSFTHLNSTCFQVFLNLISQQFADSVLIIQLDNGGFHKAKRLKVPKNIILMFQPPHAPELNPIEQVWQHLKRGLRWQLPASLDEFRECIRERLEQMTQQVIASIVGRQYILDALSVAGI